MSCSRYLVDSYVPPAIIFATHKSPNLALGLWPRPYILPCETFSLSAESAKCYLTAFRLGPCVASVSPQVCFASLCQTVHCHNTDTVRQALSVKHSHHPGSVEHFCHSVRRHCQSVALSLFVTFSVTMVSHQGLCSVGCAIVCLVSGFCGSCALFVLAVAGFAVFSAVCVGRI